MSLGTLIIRVIRFLYFSFFDPSSKPLTTQALSIQTHFHDVIEK